MSTVLLLLFPIFYFVGNDLSEHYAEALSRFFAPRGRTTLDRGAMIDA